MKADDVGRRMSDAGRVQQVLLNSGNEEHQKQGSDIPLFFVLKTPKMKKYEKKCISTPKIQKTWSYNR